MISKESILSATKPSDIFTSEENMTKEYKQLLLLYHPDKCNDSQANQICSILNELIKMPYQQKIGLYAYDYKIETNYGVLYIDVNSNRLISYCDIPEISRETKTKFPYDNQNEKRIISTITPKWIIKNERIAFPRPKGYVPLIKLLEIYKEIPPRHITWMISRLLYLCLYLESKNMINGDLTETNIFVNVDYHAIFVPTWYYSIEVNKRLKAVPGILYNDLPSSLFKNKQPTIHIDIESVKRIGRILGSTEGDISSFLKTVDTKSTAVEIWKKWDEAIHSTYGVRKWIDFPKNNQLIKL